MLSSDYIVREVLRELSYYENKRLLETGEYHKEYGRHHIPQREYQLMKAIQELNFIAIAKDVTKRHKDLLKRLKD